MAVYTVYRLHYAVDHFAVPFEGKVRTTCVKGFMLCVCCCVSVMCVLPMYYGTRQSLTEEGSWKHY